MISKLLKWRWKSTSKLLSEYIELNKKLNQLQDKQIEANRDFIIKQSLEIGRLRKEVDFLKEHIERLETFSMME